MKNLLWIGFASLLTLMIGCEQPGAEPEAISEPAAAAASADEGSEANESLAAARVLLFADGAKAESACGCGQLIRLVRMSGERGIDVQEIGKNERPELIEKYAVKAEPTVLFVDSKGEVVHRFEGEEDATIDGVREQIRELVEKS
ncbi:MAG: TlpA family protein disulfide reductase [Bradymonadaceae bacterium]